MTPKDVAIVFWQNLIDILNDVVFTNMEGKNSIDLEELQLPSKSSGPNVPALILSECKNYQVLKNKRSPINGPFSFIISCEGVMLPRVMGKIPLCQIIVGKIALH